jgi:SIR2-like domain
MKWEREHILHIGGETETPADPAADTVGWRKRIEPWLSAVFQAEHLSLLLGNGFTTGVAMQAGGAPVGMHKVAFGCPNEDKVNVHAERMAAAMGRGTANIEDQLSAALSLLAGLEILQHADALAWEEAIDKVLGGFVRQVLVTEKSIRDGLDESPPSGGPLAREVLVSFLMSFASRAASRERLHIFTTNYDRVIERGCDLAGLRIVDRFVGAIEPEFRSSRLQIDMHYTPPGIRGEPRHLEGVVHLTKLHGSLDWRYEQPRLYRTALPFGADDKHPVVPKDPHQSVIIYPNAIKDVETAAYPYVDLFRDFSTAICQPNNVLATYGYGYGDDHVNRVIADMLTIPSTHLVIIAWSEKPHERIASFVARVGRPQQLTLLIGTHFGDIQQLVEHYLPKPAIDPLTIRMTELLERRGKLIGQGF